ncbi:MAG: PQQ-binding-like beta-propeller repeat protein [Kiritimatiellae bacterium]|nr:PQQ-binding-like beta-propeller repeat protein [Kiritimatiellia bacterium]
MPIRNISRLITAIVLFAGICHADDWPQWRYDANHSASTPHPLPRELYLQWIRDLPPQTPAWPGSQKKLQFDVVSEPIVVGKLIIVPSSSSDHLTAYSVTTGKEKWRHYTGAPVRFAPTALKNKVFVVSDDGFLRCINARTGRLLWRFRGGPSDKKIIGNGRLVSMWPARGAPVIYNGTVYFTAGIWPFMGIFVHAINIKTGKPLWTNSGTGSTYMMQPHNSPAFAGVAPQGYLAATDKYLIVSGGRTKPALFDRKTGEFLYFNSRAGTRNARNGGYKVMVAENLFVNGNILHNLSDGKIQAKLPATVIDNNNLIGLNPKFSTIESWNQRITTRVLYNAASDKATTKTIYGFPVSWRYPSNIVKDGQPTNMVDNTPKEATSSRTAWNHAQKAWRGNITLEQFLGPSKIWRIQHADFKAGNILYVSGHNGLGAINLAEGTPQLIWLKNIEGTPLTMLGGADRLFAVTRENRLYCFGARKRTVLHHKPSSAIQPAQADNPRTKEILALTNTQQGYCLVLGLGNGQLINDLLNKTLFQIIVVDHDHEKIASFRNKMDSAGLYGTRVAAHVADPFNFSFPPYIATLIVSENMSQALHNPKTILAEKIFSWLRPYSGIACFPLSQKHVNGIHKWAHTADRTQYDVSKESGLVYVARPRPLPGSAPWTHQYADSANTIVSKDKLVKTPLGLLWFGGPSNDDILPRHGHGPSPQVVGGRLFIEGENMIRAVDVYTGRLLWQRELQGVGYYYRHTRHHPGANEIGSNYVSLEDGIYIMLPTKCIRLDPVTGKTLQTFPSPKTKGKKNLNWGSIRIWNDYLVATFAPLGITLRTYRSRTPGTMPPPLIGDVTLNDTYSPASGMLAVINRHTGQWLWNHKATYNFRHNAIAVENNKIFCIDGMSQTRLDHLLRRGVKPEGPATLYALDIRTGNVDWKTDENVFGTFLNYSKEYDVLLQAGSRARDRALDEVGTGIIAYSGKDGKVLWKNMDILCKGPCILHHKTIITKGSAINLLNGSRKTTRNPLTGSIIPWSFTRNYGCNTTIASEYLLTFRSAAAGFFDLTRHGTGNLGGFKSGCTSNLIPADGVLNAPDYTRTCTCSYQLQSSLAMIHMPEAELWMFNPMPRSGKQIKRMGINFGAPGDRTADDGTLWIDFPSVGGPSPNIPIQIHPANTAETFRHHSSTIFVDNDKDLPWVAASGMKGTTNLTISIVPLDISPANAIPSAGTTLSGTYKVRLHFAESEFKKAGKRIFSVAVQDRMVIKNLDIFKKAGGQHKSIVREFKNIKASPSLKITLTAKKGRPLICGIEIQALP